MKGGRFGVLGLALPLLACVAGIAAGQETGPARHVLAAGGKVTCEVVVPPEAGAVAVYAGKELSQFLSQALGAETPVLKAPSGGRVALILGRGPLLEQAGVEVDRLPRDGFVIKSAGNDILIAGKDDPQADPEKVMKTSQDFLRAQRFERGTLNGVYEFLERFVGARSYFPGPMGTIVPKRDSLSLPALDLILKPDHTARDMGYTGALPDGTDGAPAYPYKNQHRWRLRTQTRYIPCCHGLRLFDLIRRFGQSNPEYFALMDNGQRHNNPNVTHPGQLCFSSGVKEVVCQDAAAYLTGKPAESRNITIGGREPGWPRSAFQPGYVDLMPQDGLYPCNCAECQKFFKGIRYRDIDPKGASELIWGFVIDIAERLKKDNVPGYVTCMAYSAYRDVPQRAIPDNVMVMVALRGPWNAKGVEGELKLIQDWEKKIGKKVWLWNYIHKGSGMAMPGVPCMTPRAVGAYYKRVAPHIFGAYMSATTDHYLFQYLNLYVAQKVFWNNAVDVDALLDEHYRLMFGPAANSMASIYERLELNWLEKIVGNMVETDLGPASVPPSTYELWEKIYSREEMDALDRMFDAAEKAAAASRDELGRVRFMRTVLLDPLKKARGEYATSQGEIAALQHRVPRLTADASVRLDGALTEEAWRQAEPVFLRPLAAKTGAAPSPATTVRVLRDTERLYLGFDCQEPKMAQVVSEPRDADARAILRDASVEVFLNPSGDKKRYFQIVVNASGSLLDLSGEKMGASHKLDFEWTSGAAVAVKRGAQGWTAEVAVPFKSLEPFDAAGFPANFTRNRILTDEPATRFTWSPFIAESFHEIDKFGALVFADGADANLVKDSGFGGETKARSVGPWQINAPVDGADACGVDTAEFMTGGRSLRLTGRKPEDRVNAKQSLPDLKPNTEYVLSFFVKTQGIVPSRRGCGARVSIWDEKNVYYPENPYVGDIPWTRQRYTVKTGPKVNTQQKSYISLGLFEATGTVWFDDVRLVEKR